MNGVSGNHVTGGGRRGRRGRRAGVLTTALAAFASTLVVVAIAPQTAFGASMVVTTPLDSQVDGRCGFYEAVVNSQTNSATYPECPAGAGYDFITFDIPSATFGSGPYTIITTFPYPPIADGTSIDASTQPGWSPTSLQVQFDTSSASGGGPSLDFRGSAGSVVRGLIVNNGGPDAAIIAGTSSTIAGNWIGIDTAGTGPGLSQTYGVLVEDVAGVTIGGTTPADRNVIGTSGAGIKVVGSDAVNTVISGNHIGADVTGTTSIANGIGIHVAEGSSFTTIGGFVPGAGNVISGNNGEGVLLGGGPGTVSGVQVVGNLIGTQPNGTTALPNGAGIRVGFIGNAADVVSTTIGDGSAAGRNIISGNLGAGVSLADGATDTVIVGNYVGVGADGTTAVGNDDGVQVGVLGSAGSVFFTDIGSTGGVKNVISGNRHEGISIANGAEDVEIYGNYIGVGADGTTPVGNNTNGWVLPLTADPPGGYGGIVIRNFASFITIGGTGVGEANVIAHNLMGVTAFSGTSNRIVGNRIYSNAAVGLNIGPDASFTPPPNDPGDADFGANNQQNTPIISASIDSGSDLIADFSIDSIDGNSAYPIEIHFYAGANGESVSYLGSTSVAGPGAGTVNLGNNVLLGVVVGQTVVATATDADGNTSNFSAAATIAEATFTVDSVLDTPDAAIGNGICATAGGVCTLRAAIAEANATLGADAISFNIAGAGLHTITLASELPDIVDDVTIDALTQNGSSCASWPPTLNVELNATNAGFAALFVGSGSLTLRGMVINRFPTNGVSMYPPSSGNRLECNFIGTNATGDGAFGTSQTAVDLNAVDDNVIGGPLVSQRNLVAGINQYAHLFVGGDNNVVQGNYIGVDVDGGSTIDNYYNNRGVAVSGTGNLVGGLGIGEGNIIANSYGPGVAIFFGDGNDIVGNDIFGNLSDGITVPTNGNTIEANWITDNNGAGVSVTGGIGNAILDNRIADNGQFGNGNGASGVEVRGGTGTTIRSNGIVGNTGLGIDLGPAPTTPVVGDRVTFNHEGTVAGPNGYQNYPVIDYALSNTDADEVRVVGRVDGESGDVFLIDVYVNTECDATGFGEGEVNIGSFSAAADAAGVAAFDHVFTGINYEETVGLTTTATNTVTGSTSEFSYCTPLTSSNLTWVTAQTLSGTTSQYITAPNQEKWFKFPVNPGSTVSVQLVGGAGSAVSLHRDPNPIYNGLTRPENAAVLAAEAADVAFLPSGSLPSGSLPSGSLPSGSLPSGSLPSGSLETGFLPSGSLPSGSLPSGSLPSGSLPSGSLPSGSLPSGSLPSGSLPSGSLPSGSLPSGSLPSGSLPSGSLPSGSLPSGSLPSGSLDAYSSASRRSLMGVSMDPYAAVQKIQRNTFDLQENLYVRVVGPYSLSETFQISVSVTGGVCSSVLPLPDLQTMPIMSGAPPADTNRATVILTDGDRLEGTQTEIDQALADLEALANQADVQGVVLDLGDGRFPRVDFANTQADARPGCPSAKNTVATEIKRVIELFRAANVDDAGATTLQYVVLAGSAHVIPFHQVQDVAGLANEKEYVPPVDPGSPTEAGLRSGLVKGQDFYGSSVDLTIGSRTVSVPDLAVGRLVDSAVDVSTAVTAYITTGGMVAPSSSLVTGYDFVSDAAIAIAPELEQGTNQAPTEIIQPVGEEPITGWTADTLRAELLSGNHDVIMMSGHFSAGKLLAADYRTTLSAAEVTAPAVDMTDVIVMALGCHGGFSLPASDLLDGASPDPDWAKAFLRKGAAAYIAATGYAYGDTELTEYGERLFLNVARQMRTGTGPISMGKALVAAKQDYLNNTAQLTGIDEKTIVEMTLYGLPMMKVDMPGQRLSAPTDTSIVGATAPVGTGPGAAFGLRSANVNLEPATAVVNRSLENLSTGSQIVTSYLTGREGVVANPFEPIMPKQIDNVTVSGQVLRGVALRGATFSDGIGPVTPLTTAPATEVSVPHQSFNSNVFYPNQMWMPNYYDAVGGGATRLVTIPSQFRSSGPGQVTGTRRVYSELELELYYMPSDLSSLSEATRAAMVSAGPSITGASAVENPDGSITFSVNALTDGIAGTQSVWVLITGDGGLAGTWLELVLTPSATDPTLWTGTLTSPPTSAAAMRFMVQAVSGAGLTTLATNLGAFYAITDPSAPPPVETQIVDVQFNGTPQFQTPVEVTARVVTLPSGGPVAGQTVVFDLDGQQALAVTGADGRATASLTPIVAPGAATLQASLPGTSAFVTSTAAVPVAIDRQSTSLAVSPAPGPVGPDEATGLFVDLTDASDRGLGGKSIVFEISKDTFTTVRLAAADNTGRAQLGPLGLPAGTYDVSITFGSIIDLGVGEPLDYTDESYRPSGPELTTVTVVDGSAPTIEAVTTTSPVGLPYTLGDWTTQNVLVDFTCDDGPLGGIASCGPDTTVTAEGSATVIGTAVDTAGLETDTSVGPIRIDRTGPAIAVTVPAANATIALGAVVNAAYTCTDAGAGPGTCVGPVASGSPIDTATPGIKSFVVNATDVLGNPSTLTVTYTVGASNAAPVVRADMGVAGLQDVGFRTRLIVLTGSFSDPDGTGRYTASIRWTPTGAFSPLVLTLGSSFVASYVAPTNGTRVVTVRICDALGACGTDDVTVRTGVTATINPVRQCVVDRGRNARPRYEARFGYDNPAAYAIVEPTVNKVDNFFTSNPAFRGQPQVFLPGSKRNVFSVNFHSGSISWKLDGKTVTANSSSPRC